MQPCSDRDPAPVGAKSYHVHFYTAIRIRVAVTGHDHRSAMKAADQLLFEDGLPVTLVASAAAVEAVDHADEVLVYLVDEAGDEDHRQSRCYGPYHRPEIESDAGIAARFDHD